MGTLMIYLNGKYKQGIKNSDRVRGVAMLYFIVNGKLSDDILGVRNK